MKDSIKLVEEAINLVLKLVILVLSVFICSSNSCANQEYQETIKKINKEKLAVEALLEQYAAILEPERINSTREQIEKVTEFVEKATEYVGLDDPMEAELNLELAKLFLGRAYAQASRSFTVEERIISLDAHTLSRLAIAGEMEVALDKIKNAGFNTIFVEVLRDDGYVVYPSEIMKQATELEGKDPLRDLVQLAQKRDLDVFPWLKVFFAAANGMPGPILEEHPEWTALDRNGKGLDAYNLAWFSPANIEARTFMKKYIMELWSQYDFAGCQLDYVRNAVNPLEDNDFSYDQATLDLFYDLYGYNPLTLPYPSAAKRTQSDYTAGDFGPKWENWQAFREELVTSFVAQLSLQLKEIKPDKFIGAGIMTALWGGGTLQQALFRQQNWPVWVERHHLEYLSPLVYQNETRVVVREVKNVREIAKERVLIYPSLGVQAMDAPYSLLQQIEAVRDLGEVGMRVFAYPHMQEEHFKLLAEGPFRNNAYPPHRDLLKSSYQLLREILANFTIDEEDYNDLDRLFKRLESALDASPKQRYNLIRPFVKRTTQIAERTIDKDLHLQLTRLSLMLTVYEYTNRSVI